MQTVRRVLFACTGESSTNASQMQDLCATNSVFCLDPNANSKLKLLLLVAKLPLGFLAIANLNNKMTQVVIMMKICIRPLRWKIL